MYQRIEAGNTAILGYFSIRIEILDAIYFIILNEKFGTFKIGLLLNLHFKNDKWFLFYSTKKNRKISQCQYFCENLSNAISWLLKYRTLNTNIHN